MANTDSFGPLSRFVPTSPRVLEIALDQDFTMGRTNNAFRDRVGAAGEWSLPNILFVGASPMTTRCRQALCVRDWCDVC